VQLPDAGLSQKQKGLLRAQKLMEYGPLIKINEIYLGDEFAMRMKILSPDKKTSHQTFSRSADKIKK
jgi:hypothetical protein